MKKTPLKAKSQLKAKTSLKSKSGLKKTTTLKAKSPLCSFSALKNSGTALKKTILNKQNKEAKDKWEETRQKVIQRDKGKCQICRKPGTQVHHIHMRMLAFLLFPFPIPIFSISKLFLSLPLTILTIP